MGEENGKCIKEGTATQDMSTHDLLGWCDKLHKCYREKGKDSEDSKDSWNSVTGKWESREDSVDDPVECAEEGGICVDQDDSMDVETWKFIGWCNLTENCYRKHTDDSPSDSVSDDDSCESRGGNCV